MKKYIILFFFFYYAYCVTFCGFNEFIPSDPYECYSLEPLGPDNQCCYIKNEEEQICEEFEYIPVGDIIQKYPYFKDYEISCEYEHPEAEPKKEEAEIER